jgi:hypothetical protein
VVEYDYFFENDSALYRSLHEYVSAILFVYKSPDYFEIDSVEENYPIIGLITNKALNKCSNIEKLCKISY